MGQVTVTTPWAVSTPEPQNAIILPQERARKQALVAAVQVLNQAGVADAGREVTFTRNPATRSPVVRVVDAQSGEVIVQWPTEYALRLAEAYKKENTGK